ncbi:MAG: OmpA family protein [bacterium]
MFKKIVSFVFLIFFSLVIAGCFVTKGTYLKKVNEAETLTQDLDSLKQQYNDLRTENDKLNQQIEKLKSEVEDLESVLEARSDELSTKIVLSRQKIADLEKEKEEKIQKIAELEQKNSELQQQISQLKQQISEIEAEKEEKLKEVSKTYGSMIEKMKAEIEEGQVTITELKGKLTVNMLDAVLFDLGKAEIRPEGLVVLQKVIDVLKDVEDRVIRVEGHTDNLQIHGALAQKYPTNWELSAARAVNVAKYLQKQGIDPNILSATAFGEYKPVADNDTEEGRAKNRRIEIVLLPKEFR